MVGDFKGRKQEKCFVRKTKTNKIKLVGNRQIKNISKKIKSWSVLDTFSSDGCTKSSKFETVMIVQTHADNEENTGCFLFFQKKH